MLFTIIFFFQAEDGIRDIGVTGVQTCALPIYLVYLDVIAFVQNVTDSLFQIFFRHRDVMLMLYEAEFSQRAGDGVVCKQRSEERRVGKECRDRWSPDH